MFEIAAANYRYIYLALITIMTLFVCLDYFNRNGIYQYNENKLGGVVVTFLVVLFLIFFVGFRPVSGRYFVDMANYVLYYNTLYDGTPFTFDLNAENLLFDNIFAWWGSHRLGYVSFFVFIACIYFGASFLGISRIFPNHTFAAYLVFLGAFSTFSYATNGIKAGAAASLFIWAYSYRDKIFYCVPLLLLSWGFHHSMQLPIAAFCISLFIKDTRLFLVGWIICFFISLFHISFFAELFASISDESGSGYLMGAANGLDGTKGGFRFDFVLYSSMPVLIGYWTIFKRKLVVSYIYREFLNFYLCTNGVWMLCMYASFTNRIAYLSWFMYPIVLVYPFLNENSGIRRFQVFSIIMMLHLLFTLFLLLIY